MVGLLLLGSGSAYAQFAVGLKGGLPLTDFLHAASNPSATFPSRSDRFIVGPTVEVTLPFGFGVELDALYRRFDYRAVESILGTPVTSSATSAWEFPLLVKYKTPGILIRPFVDAGVSFDRWKGLKRVTNALNITNSDVGVTGTGVVLGGGFEVHLPFIRISPELRFTRWGAKDLSDLGQVFRFNQNQAEVLLGITF
jgi:hypothetical protein